MATGDLEAVANHIARQVGIDRVIARATPADKLELIRSCSRRPQSRHDRRRHQRRAGAGRGRRRLRHRRRRRHRVESADITLVGGDIARVAGGIELSRRP
jgi:Cu+-exporting ATPase